MKSARSRSRSSVDAAWITPRTLPLDRPALLPPARDPTVDHVDHAAGAEALEQAGGHRRAGARSADGGDGPLGVELVRQLAEVVVGPVEGLRDVARVPLGPLAHVEDLHGVRI